MKLPKRDDSNARSSKIRIIGGKWRGRKLDFPSLSDLRPTPDRIRETVFNWLAPSIHEAACMDLFSGSGALGFEALSRGAKAVTLVEKNSEAIQFLKKNAARLSAETAQIVEQDVFDWLQQPSTPMDVIFIDPPYQQACLPHVFQKLTEGHWLKENSLIYCEHHAPLQEKDWPEHWHCLKSKKAGQVYYYLAEYQGLGATPP